ncbi:hypothetical protein EFR58_07605 [Lactobacillus delbrueckii subsp. bulgaricus]|nr:hypothetical protein [Lactobacillus delbrueckii subsp. bulgaricus]
MLDGVIETLARKKLEAYTTGAMPIRVSSIDRVYDQQTKLIANVVVSLVGNLTDGSGDYINCRTTISKKDLPSGKSFAIMTAADFKVLAKAKLVELTKVA